MKRDGGMRLKRKKLRGGLRENCGKAWKEREMIERGRHPYH
jgi:hypothetical protein